MQTYVSELFVPQFSSFIWFVVSFIQKIEIITFWKGLNKMESPLKTVRSMEWTKFNNKEDWITQQLQRIAKCHTIKRQNKRRRNLASNYFYFCVCDTTRIQHVSAKSNQINQFHTMAITKTATKITAKKVWRNYINQLTQSLSLTLWLIHSISIYLLLYQSILVT